MKRPLSARCLWARRLLAVASSVLVVGGLSASPALATVAVTRASLSGTSLRIEGTAAPNRVITVNAAALGSSDSSGKFRISRDPFAAPSDCMAAVNDGSTSPARVRLSGCTVTGTPPPPTGGLTFLTPALLPDAQVGQAYLASIVVDDPPGPSTFTFTVVAGRVPAGTRFVRNTLPARPESRVVGTPTAAGTSSFTVEARDGTGATARRTFSVTVLGAPGLAIAGGVNVLAAGTVGQPYGAVLSATGGVQPYTWGITAGALPPGLRLVGDAFFGTPSAAGSYAFTARVTDSRGATASGQFSITVGT